MKHSILNKFFLILFLNVIAVIIAYYISLLLHEWGHGTVAWIYGLKHSPFNIQYGGWFLQKADEHVNYTILFNSGRHIQAALIGIAGPIVSLTLVTICFVLLAHTTVQQNTIKFTFAYWFLIINMIPTIQYFTVSTFSPGGDTGHFAHGLNISGWWLFIPGTVLNMYLVWKILKVEMIRAYVFIPIKNVFIQNIFLLSTLSIMFLFIYTHSYNPLADKGIDLFGKVLVMLSIILVPVLFILCNPIQTWVRQSIDLMRSLQAMESKRRM